MPVCDICSEELMCDSELKTHLLLTHLENEASCPLCFLSGVSYDELNYHFNTAHVDMDAQHTPGTGDLRLMGLADTKPDQSERASDLPGVSTSSGSQDLLGAAETPVRSPVRSPVRTPLRSPGAASSHRKNREGLMEHHKSKQKRLSSPQKEKKFSCPMCSLVCTDCFLLQEHVELHLQHQTVPEDLSADLSLATRLQEGEERRRKEEETKREAEDFKRLQFGMDNGGGYRKQMERNMERAVSRGHMTPSEFHRKRVEMMETLASGVDDGRTRTSGLMSALYDHYQREIRDVARVWLCSEADHFSSSEGDHGWGCGYRNFQMLLSSLLRLDLYTGLKTLPDSLPSIPQVQALIEAAWAEGIDPQGASQFNRRLKGTRAWIGATEIYAVLTSLRLRGRIMDFHQPTGPSDTHPRLFEWVKNYFCAPYSGGPRTPPRVVRTNLPPIYLQHQGHSRTIVGVEEKKNGSVCALMFDPGCSSAETRKLLSPGAKSTSFNRLRRFPSHLKHRQYQVVVVEGVLTEQEKQDRVCNSRTLRAERIP
ncbi:zinc finger-containing ubiquitin peptidase 1 isoform X2 [Trichomycterus rosablanca]|uniref:zinc finger-containing ubiquitin peptidase 1 isoform X2 n=1 Tax=Trichomycterus rosablanca TaxID=2290929 RepID=UPI002F35BB4E